MFKAENEFLAFFGEGIFNTRGSFCKFLFGDKLLTFEFLETLGEGAGADVGQGDYESAKALSGVNLEFMKNGECPFFAKILECFGEVADLFHFF